MKIVIVAALLAGCAMLFATRKDTPFLRWGIIIALAGVLLAATSTMFTVRGFAFGMILTVLGVGLYYFGRFARNERFFLR